MPCQWALFVGLATTITAEKEGLWERAISKKSLEMGLAAADSVASRLSLRRTLAVVNDTA